MASVESDAAATPPANPTPAAEPDGTAGVVLMRRQVEALERLAAAAEALVGGSPVPAGTPAGRAEKKTRHGGL
jgi:hypothetical protein